ncbi:MAG: hypothetical protein KatS3mg010_1255 [Acidimicrobiia bacterium]|nr:MAG: hypothetical protein KatS3mg010_1255 [Acidimicrobiia bacterium]
MPSSQIVDCTLSLARRMVRRTLIELTCLSFHRFTPAGKDGDARVAFVKPLLFTQPFVRSSVTVWSVAGSGWGRLQLHVVQSSDHTSIFG